MSVLDVPGRVGHWFAALPPHKQALLVLATTVFVVELALRRLAPKSRFYKRWTAVFEAIGSFWSAVVLSLVYFLTISVISLFMKMFGKDPLDRGLAPEPTFWRSHEPNPLGPLAASRHQF